MTQDIFEKHRRTLRDRSYFSQAAQDLFVLTMLQGKRGGTYCEIGGADPFDSNNSFLLEHDFGWSGISVEFDSALVDKFNLHRRNKCLHRDATTLDYRQVFLEQKFPTQIDYLSVDIEPAENTYKALTQIPFDSYRFSVITYEHDFHMSGPEYMHKSREFLQKQTYQLVVQNVNCFGRDFEDWWVDPSIVPETIWKKFQSAHVEFSHLF